MQFREPELFSDDEPRNNDSPYRGKKMDSPSRGEPESAPINIDTRANTGGVNYHHSAKPSPSQPIPGSNSYPSPF